MSEMIVYAGFYTLLIYKGFLSIVLFLKLHKNLNKTFIFRNTLRSTARTLSSSLFGRMLEKWGTFWGTKIGYLFLFGKFVRLYLRKNIPWETAPFPYQGRTRVY
ncbi:hypothetical protein TS65_31440 [Aneurinibacillus migulanus]|uniref:Uncharacterized protein n=1 Tax=Aneurinibacillus migulanus TaxID=47500 RepID=A0A0D1VU43_ANEMI|nr:hypothetical protein TS65_31440 [Aneurinibacillus migulanus]KON95892.1 hypothetical protein AF333_10765 [Aneurinibacillus migulanus]